MSYIYLQEQGEESSAGCFSDIPAYVLSRLNLTHERSSCSDNETESYQSSQSGTTCAHLTENHGEERLTSCAVGSHAKTSARRGKVPACLENDQGYGLRWPASSAKYDRDTSSWKIHPCLFQEDSIECSVTLPKWGMMQDGELSVQQTPERLTCENDYGLWQTLVADDAVARKEGKWNSRGEPKLSAQVLLPTLTVHGNYNRKGVSAASGDGLATVMKRLPRLVARDYRYPGKSRLERTGSKSGDVLPQEIGGPLNPTWCEWFMGFPLEWTALKPLVTDKFQQWLHSHGKS